MNLGKHRTSDVARLIKCRIVDYNADACTFTVVPFEQPHEERLQGIPAKLISPFPFDPKGGGMQSVPVDPAGTGCLCVAIGPREYYIVGFFQYSSNQLNLHTQSNIKLEAGETYVGHNTGTHMRMTKHGMFSIFTNIFAQMHIDPIAQTLLANFKNIAINTYGGWLKWTHQLTTGSTNLRGEIHKRFDLSAVKNVLPTEKIKFNLGTLNDDTHIAELDVLQEPQSKTSYNIASKLKYGLQKTTRKMLSWTLSDTKAKQTYSLDMDLKGKIIWENLQENKSHNMKVTLDTDGDNAAEILINDRYGNKVTLRILQTGETFYDVNNGTANLKIEPSGNTTFNTQGNTVSNIQGNATTSITGNKSVTVSGNQTENISGTLNLTISGTVNINSSSTINIVGGNTINLNGGTAPILTTATDPVIDLIFGIATKGTTTTRAGGPPGVS